MCMNRWDRGVCGTGVRAFLSILRDEARVKACDPLLSRSQ